MVCSSAYVSLFWVGKAGLLTMMTMMVMMMVIVMMMLMVRVRAMVMMTMVIMVMVMMVVMVRAPASVHLKGRLQAPLNGGTAMPGVAGTCELYRPVWFPLVVYPNPF